MNKFTKIIAATSLVFASVSASADEMTVGGVTWDPDFQTLSAADFISLGTFTQWYSTVGLTPGGAPDLNAVTPGTAGSTLQGIGEINFFNGKSALTTPFVCGTCELTFAFGGLQFDGDLTDGSLFDLAASASTGFFNIYFDDSADFDAGNITGQADSDAAVDGELFLGLSFANLTEGAGFTPASGYLDSFWNVSGGAAAYHFDTDSQLFGADINFGANVVFQPGIPYGSANGLAVGNTIPEPTSLAIFGLGLLGLAGASRRKKS